MNITQIALIITAGIFSGFLNTLAGGGSLITLPLIIFIGIPASIANGTNRIALAVQNIFAVVGFSKKGIKETKLSIFFAIPAVIGAIIGANISVNIPDALFKKLLGIILIIGLIFILWNPAKKIKVSSMSMGYLWKIACVIIFFFIGMYGGIFQAGVGFIFIIFLRLLTGWDLVKINAVKVFIVLIYTLFAIIIFIYNNKINWQAAIFLSMGNGLGAFIGTNIAVKKGEKFIRWVVILAILAMSIKLLIAN